MGTLGSDFLNNGYAVRVKVIGKRFQGSFADPVARALRPAVGVAALPGLPSGRLLSPCIIRRDSGAVGVPDGSAGH
jgi:hypothetical protein